MNLIKSTGTFGFYTILSRLLGYLRDVLIAIFLGASFVADAFFVAFRIPNTFRRLFAEGTFNAAFVPSYASELVKKKTKSNKFANDIFNLLFLGLLFLTIVIEIFMPVFVSLIAPGFIEDQKKINLAIDLTRITFPFLMFVSLSSFFAAILNSHNKFAAASAAPIILNIVLILILFFGKYLGDQLAKDGFDLKSQKTKNYLEFEFNATTDHLRSIKDYFSYLEKDYTKISYEEFMERFNGLETLLQRWQAVGIVSAQKALEFVNQEPYPKIDFFDLDQAVIDEVREPKKWYVDVNQSVLV